MPSSPTIEPRAGVTPLRLSPCLPPRAVRCGSGPQRPASWSPLRPFADARGLRRLDAVPRPGTSDWIAHGAQCMRLRVRVRVRTLLLHSPRPCPYHIRPPPPQRCRARPLSEQSSRAETRGASFVRRSVYCMNSNERNRLRTRRKPKPFRGAFRSFVGEAYAGPSVKETCELRRRIWEMGGE